VLFDTGTVKVGAFRCGVHHDAFQDSGPIQHYPFVFPRTAVTIAHDHEHPFVANANVVTFYNRGDRYRRYRISNEGDRCDWFAITHGTLLEAARALEPSVDDRPEQPFCVSHASCDAHVYAVQRRIFSAIERDGTVDALFIEEAVIRLLESVLRSSSAVQRRRHASLAPNHRRQVDLVDAAKAFLSRHFAKPLTLASIADALGVSLFHLCRAFRQLTGCTLHEYRHQLRLRWSLEQLEAPGPRAIVHCALDAGFSSHSHYGAAFRRSFGQTPSAYACMLRSGRLSC
jgi:AraC-like DNA-binding protein